MNRDAIRAAVAAAGARQHGGTPAHVHQRTFVEVTDGPPQPTPLPKVPAMKPTPISTSPADVEPHGGGTAQPDTVSGYDIARIVDNVQSGTPSMSGYRDRAAVVNTRR